MAKSANNDRVESSSQDRNPNLRDMGNSNSGTSPVYVSYSRASSTGDRCSVTRLEWGGQCKAKQQQFRTKQISDMIASVELQMPTITPVLPEWDLGIVLEALSKPMNLYVRPLLNI